jgi:hypothetical protein
VSVLTINISMYAGDAFVNGRMKTFLDSTTNGRYASGMKTYSNASLACCMCCKGLAVAWV